MSWLCYHSVRRRGTKKRRLRSACLLSDYYSAKLDVFQHLDFLFSLCPIVFTVVHVGGRELNDSCLYRQNFEILEMSLWPHIAGKYLDQLRRPLWIFVNVIAQTAIRCSISSLMYCIQIILGGGGNFCRRLFFKGDSADIDCQYDASSDWLEQLTA